MVEKETSIGDVRRINNIFWRRGRVIFLRLVAVRNDQQTSRLVQHHVGDDAVGESRYHTERFQLGQRQMRDGRAIDGGAIDKEADGGGSLKRSFAAGMKSVAEAGELGISSQADGKHGS